MNIIKVTVHHIICCEYIYVCVCFLVCVRVCACVRVRACVRVHVCIVWGKGRHDSTHYKYSVDAVLQSAPMVHVSN